MSDTPKKEPPFTDCPKTEKVFPFKRMDDGHWYRYQSDAIDLCEKLERENASVRAALKTALAIESLDEANLEQLIARCRRVMREQAAFDAARKEQL